MESAERDVRFLHQKLDREVLERGGTGGRIGVGVVVRQDDELTGTVECLEQGRQGSAIIVGAVNRHSVVVAALAAHANRGKLDTVSPMLSTPSYAVRHRAARSAAPAVRSPGRMPSS